MWTCPNCQKQQPDGPTRCRFCGFDGSIDVLRYPTLVPRASSARPTSAQNAVFVSEPDIPEAPKSDTFSETDTRPAPVEPKSNASDSNSTPPKRTFSKRLAAALAGAVLCIGGAVFALRSHETALPAVSSAVSSSVVSSAVIPAASDASDSAVSSTPASSASAASVSSKVQAFRNSKLHALGQLSHDALYQEYQITYSMPSEDTSFSYTQISTSYQGMSYLKIVEQGQTQTIITRDGFSYQLFPSQKVMFKTAVSTQSSSIDLQDEDSIEQALEDGTLVLTTSTKTINGTSYHAETLSGDFTKTLLDDGTSYSYTITYCFEGDTLCYMLVDANTNGEASSTQMKVLRQSYDVDKSLFELPDYKVYTASASGRYYDENGKEADYETLYS